MKKTYLWLLLLLTLPVYGVDYWYSLATLRNDSPHTVYYSYRWGETGATYKTSLRPGKSVVHYWTFQYRNQNTAPPFLIKIDGDPSTSWYALQSFFSPDCALERGRPYRIRFIVEDLTPS